MVNKATIYILLTIFHSKVFNKSSFDASKPWSELMIFSRFCFYISSLASFLLAARISDVIRVENFPFAPELSGYYGIVENVKTDYQVSVFLPERLNGDFSDSFRTVHMLPENLTVIERKDLNNVIIDAETSLEACEQILNAQNFSADKMARFFFTSQRLNAIEANHIPTSRKFNQSLRLAYTWMNLTFGFSSSSAWKMMSPFQPGSFIRATDLKIATHYIGCLGLILERYDTRCQVLLFLPSTVPHFKLIALKDENMYLITRTELQFNHIFNSPVMSFLVLNVPIGAQVHMVPGFPGSDTLTVSQKQTLAGVTDLILTICKGKPESLLNDENVKRKVQLIGIWIVMESGPIGLQYVQIAKEALKPALKQIWTEIELF